MADLQSPIAQSLLAAGVPEEEVLANLRRSTGASSGQPTSAVGPAGPPLEPIVTRVPSAPEPLPRGWEERFDPSSGRRFYIDFVNQTTSWTRPAPEGATLRQSVSGLSRDPVTTASWQLANVDASLTYPAFGPRSDIPTATATPAPAAAGLDEASAAPATSPGHDRDGFFGKFSQSLFGRPKARPVEAAGSAAAPTTVVHPAFAGPTAAPIASPVDPTLARPVVAPSAAAPATLSPVTVHQLLEVVGRSSAQMAERLRAASELSQQVKRLRQDAAKESLAAADVEPLQEANSGEAPCNLIH